MGKSRNQELEKELLLSFHFLSGGRSGGTRVSLETETIHTPNLDDRDSFPPLGTPGTGQVNQIDPPSDLPLQLGTIPQALGTVNFPGSSAGRAEAVGSSGTAPVNKVDQTSDLPVQFGSYALGTVNFPPPNRDSFLPLGTTPITAPVKQIDPPSDQLGTIPPQALGTVNFPGSSAGRADAAVPFGTAPVNQVDQTNDQSAQVERQIPDPMSSLSSRYRNQSRMINWMPDLPNNNIEAAGPGLEDLPPYQGEMEDMSNTYRK